LWNNIPKGRRRLRFDAKLLPVVKEILFREWDPIGVNGNEACRNEYDGYAPALLRLLLSGADEYKIAARLSELQRVSMGMSLVDDANHQRIARRLIGLLERD
jgi:hypothetical protein